MQRDELAAWLRLTGTPGIGNGSARRLLAAFGLPQAVLEQSGTALRQVISAAQVRALQSTSESFEAQLDTTWGWLQGDNADAARAGPQPVRRLLALGDADYPESLLRIEDPPLLLYLLGGPPLADFATTNSAFVPVQSASEAMQLIANSLLNGIALVGSRNPSAQGLEHARQFARALGRAGLTVVSGLALGIDAAAHQGALDAAAEARPLARLATLAVVGTGLDRVYPSRHHALAHRIAECGLIVSEYPLGTPPLPANFPRRNRLIAALTQGTLVVEAALQSGSLITARLAAEQGKEVFAIPGSIQSPHARGCHALIRQGAKLVESAQDILEELRLPSSSSSATEKIAANADQTRTTTINTLESDGDDGSNSLLAQLGYDPVSIDALTARTGIDTAPLQVALLELELAGRVARLPGGLFQRAARG